MAIEISPVAIFETYRLGFPLRVYSYAPTGFPRPFWAKVVERVIYLPSKPHYRLFLTVRVEQGLLLVQ